MFKELFPNNEIFGTILDTILITLGGLGGIAGLITWSWKVNYEARVKVEIEKNIEGYKAELHAKAAELSQTLTEKITRRSKAFDLRINKEYEFYEKFGTYSNKLTAELFNINCSLHCLNNGHDLANKYIADINGNFFDIQEDSDSLYFAYYHYVNDDISSCLDNLSNDIEEYREQVYDLVRQFKTVAVAGLEELLLDYQKPIFKRISELHGLIKTTIDRASDGKYDLTCN